MCFVCIDAKSEGVNIMMASNDGNVEDIVEDEDEKYNYYECESQFLFHFQANNLEIRSNHCSTGDRLAGNVQFVQQSLNLYSQWYSMHRSPFTLYIIRAQCTCDYFAVFEF